MEKLKVDIEEHEYLLELIDGPGYKVLIEKVLPQLLKKEADKVLMCRPENQAERDKLAYMQALYQGCRIIVEDIKALKSALRNKRS